MTAMGEKKPKKIALTGGKTGVSKLEKRKKLPTPAKQRTT